LNENYAQPSLPAGVEGDVIRGLYRVGGHTPDGAVAHVRLLGSGAILREVIAAAQMLATEWRIASDVYSATSFAELAREAAEVERDNRLHPGRAARDSHVQRMLGGDRLVVAATDYVRAYPQLIAPYLSARYVTLGTDGFGRSDTREAVRRFFEVDRASIVLATLHALAQQGRIATDVPARAIEVYQIATGEAPPWTR
jgi:pyruvate dehydrogenase E1 component